MLEQFEYDTDSEAEICIFSLTQLNAEMVGQFVAASLCKEKHPYYPEPVKLAEVLPCVVLLSL